MNQIVTIQPNAIEPAADSVGDLLHRLGTDYDAIHEAIRTGGGGERTKTQYIRTLTAFERENGRINLFDAEAVKTAVSDLSPVRRSYMATIIGRARRNVQQRLNSIARPDNLASIMAASRRLDALESVIQVKQKKGRKTHIWLSADEFVNLCRQVEGESARARRDLLVLLLLGDCGLRRAEAAALRFGDVLKQGNAYVLRVIGKGEKERTVPIAQHTKALIDQMQSDCGGRHVLKRFDRHGNCFDGLSGHGIADIVKKYGRYAGHMRLMPHD